VKANVPEFIVDRLPLTCVARPKSTSPATGSRASHLYEQKKLIDEALR
jgi:2-oxoglutarate dehydrogenase E1 component